MWKGDLYIHTCQPSRSRRDSPDFGDQNFNPTSRPTTQKKPTRNDLSQATSKNTILNLPFTCSLCSSVGIQVSSVPFGLFPCTRPWRAVIQTKICNGWKSQWPFARVQQHTEKLEYFLPNVSSWKALLKWW